MPPTTPVAAPPSPPPGGLFTGLPATPAAAAEATGVAKHRLPSEITSQRDVEDLMRYLAAAGVYDLKFQHGYPVIGEVGGKLQRVTDRGLTQADMLFLLPVLAGKAAESRLAADKVIDSSYEFYADQRSGRTLRYRINVSCSHPGTEIQISCRKLEDDIPFLGAPRRAGEIALDVEPDLIAHFRESPGITLINGKTNSGKTWLTAAAIDDLRTSVPEAGAITTYEEPIEFVHPKDRPYGFPIAQHEVGRDVKSFAQGLRSTTRRNPWLIFIGETRDAETLDALIAAADQGPRAWATTHARTVSGTFRRIYNLFPEHERRERAHSFLDLATLVVSQFLVPKRVPPGAPPARVAIREWLVIDGTVRRQLREHPPARWPAKLAPLVARHGRPALESARIAFKAGLIEEATCQRFAVLDDDESAPEEVTSNEGTSNRDAAA